MLSTTDDAGGLRRRRKGTDDEAEVVVQLPPLKRREKQAIQDAKRKKEERKGAAVFFIFFVLALGIPAFIIYRNTPFFIFESLRCRLTDRFVWSDRTAAASELAYEKFFHSPPLFGSDEWNRTMFWGTYEPSKLFAMKTMSDKPLSVGIAWYDDAGRFPLRHTTALLHNRVLALRSNKRGSEEDTMRVEWTAHDGHHYGDLTITDYPLNLRLEIEFLKSPFGDGWHVRAHGTLEPPDGEKASNIHFVVYILNDDEDENVEVENGETAMLSGLLDFSPSLTTRMWNHAGKKEKVVLRIEDDHSPFAVLKPWRILKTRSRAGDASMEERDGTAGAGAQDYPPFAFRISDTFGGRVRERIETEGKTRTGLSESDGGARGVYESPTLNLRDISCHDHHQAQGSSPVCVAASPQNTEANNFNMVVLKREYNADFRLEISLTSPDRSLDEAARETGRYERLSVCQATNMFRRRARSIRAHHLALFKTYVSKNQQVETGSASLNQRIATSTLSELLGSMAYTQGRYALASSPDSSSVSLSSHAASAFSFVGSRTDEPFGRQDVTGLQLIFLVRYNKELVKSVLHSWLVQSQDTATGFIPTRTGFNTYMRSLMPKEDRVEHLTHGTPPTLLLGLQELLREMQRKGDRVRARRDAKARARKKARNSDDYLQREREGDIEYLKALLPSLKRWRQWWHTTQCGGVSEEGALHCAGNSDSETHTSRRPLESWPSRPTGNPDDQLAYRWRSRTNAMELPSSGLGDYPRPTCAGEDHRELHVDLFSWIALLSRLISTIEVDFLGVEESVKVDWESHLEALHWDNEHEYYADRVGCRPTAGEAMPSFSPYLGIANMFPVMLGIPRRESLHVLSTMSIGNYNLSDTGHGLQSLTFTGVREMRVGGMKHHNAFTGTIWPHLNLMYAYALKGIYWNALSKKETYLSSHIIVGGGSEGEPPAAAEEGDEADLRLKGVQRTARAEYRRLRQVMAPQLLQVTRWWECYNPVTGEGLGGKTYIGSRALLLGFLYNFE